MFYLIPCCLLSSPSQMIEQDSLPQYLCSFYSLSVLVFYTSPQCALNQVKHLIDTQLTAFSPLLSFCVSHFLLPSVAPLSSSSGFPPSPFFCFYFLKKLELMTYFMSALPIVISHLLRTTSYHREAPSSHHQLFAPSGTLDASYHDPRALWYL